MLRVKTLELLGTTAVFASEAMQRVFAFAERVGKTDATVLITGESGCGKELVARAVHQYSARSSGPWVDVNCSAIPENLLESELFGYEKGAFSGADSAKPGLFELAHGGTLFLDEIGDLDPRIQAKLLRVLDGATYYRLGGVRKTSVNVRIVAATNQPLEKIAERGEFRTDLFHRLAQVVIDVTPLRRRLEDVEPLANHFITGQNPALHLSADALSCLRAYSWPGNVRELRNVIVHAAVFAKGPVILREDLPDRLQAGGFVQSLQRLAVLDELERDAIVGVMRETNGHQQRAANRLGISKRTLQRKLKAYSIDRLEHCPMAETA